MAWQGDFVMHTEAEGTHIEQREQAGVAKARAAVAGGEAEERWQSDHQWKRMREGQKDLVNNHTGFDRSLLHERSEETNYNISMVLGRATAGSAWIGKAQKEKI